jgi:hypothetical protein
VTGAPSGPVSPGWRIFQIVNLDEQGVGQFLPGLEHGPFADDFGDAELGFLVGIIFFGIQRLAFRGEVEEGGAQLVQAFAVGGGNPADSGEGAWGVDACSVARVRSGSGTYPFFQDIHRRGNRPHRFY